MEERLPQVKWAANRTARHGVRGLCAEWSQGRTVTQSNYPGRSAPASPEPPGSQG
ncbi:hypothetical protein GCM10009759_75750 [Kitasatospora saccharophila]|uniref:Uncharacterized protein n=1 Tax=Kitasatospora saccharophila TaxID=407973 RepID=A0ABN2YDH6_9ACTN